MIEVITDYIQYESIAELRRLTAKYALQYVGMEQSMRNSLNYANLKENTEKGCSHNCVVLESSKVRSSARLTTDRP